MKNILFFIFVALATGFTSCSHENSDIETPTENTQVSLVGNWYEEATNEEVRYNTSGTYYNKYADFEHCNETEGSWKYDSKSQTLSEEYTYLGTSVVSNFIVKGFTEYGFILSSPDIGNHKYEKIVEEYTLKVGETANIQFANNYPAYQVVSYSSNNERIVSVSSSGVLKAEGEKGTAYIKVTTKDFNIWVKVVVGDNIADLWYDYISLIGENYSNVRTALISCGEPVTGDDGYSFLFTHENHNIIDFTKIYLNKEKGTVTEIQLVLKDAASETEILQYMNSHYYKLMETDSYVYYTTQENMNASRAVVVYSNSNGYKEVIIMDREAFLSQGESKELWPNFTAYFDNNKGTINSAMTSAGYDFSFSDYSYSKYGADYYYISDNEYISIVAFVYNSDYKMSEIWAYSYTMSTKVQEMYDYLKSLYTRQKDEDETGKYVFYNKDKSIRVVLDQVNSAIIYTNMNMKQDYGTSDDSFGSYNESIGKTKEEIISAYGIPYVNNGNNLYYIPDNANLSYVVFTLSESTGLCYAVSLILKDNVEASTVVKSFSTNYTVYEKGTLSDGSQYGWIDGTSLDNSSIGILYYVEDKIISYVLLSANKNSASAIKRVIKIR